MTTEQVWLVAVGAVALLALLVAVLSWRAGRRTSARAAELTTRLAGLASTVTTRPVVETEAPYVITALETDRPGASPPPGPTGPVERIDGRLFTDIVARATVVRAASWSQGIRRALSPESRNRIRFQVRQQGKQARRDRRSEAREALRAYRARQRADEGDAA